MLIDCESCGYPVSRNAGVCPNCGKAPKAGSAKASSRGLFGCRKCGTELALHQYRGVGYHQAGFIARIQGDTATITPDTYTTYNHRACPNCGEPKPLLAYSETIFGRIHGGFLKLVTFFAIMCSLYYCATLFRAVSALVTKFDYHGLAQIPLFLSTLLAGTALLILSYRYAEFGTSHARRWVFAVPVVFLVLIYQTAFR